MTSIIRSNALSCLPARRSGLELLLPGVRRSPRRVTGADAQRGRGRSAAFVQRARRRAVHSRDDAGGPLPHRRPAGPRRHGRSLSSRRSEARTSGGFEIPAERGHASGRPARAVPPGSAPRAAGLTSECVPRPRHRRNQRPALPLHGIHRRRGSRLVAAAHRPIAIRQGARARAPALRWPRGCTRPKGSASRSEACQRPDRRAGSGAPRRFRPRGSGGPASRRGRHCRNARLHGARAVGRARAHDADRRVCARPRVVRDVHGQACARRRVPLSWVDARRPSWPARRRTFPIWIRPSSASSCAA